jgi:hypothetical protein
MAFNGSECRLVGDPAAFARSRGALQQIRNRQRAVETTKAEFESKGINVPDCAAFATGATPDYLQKWLSSADAKSKLEIGATIDRFRKHCDDTARSDEAAVYAPLKGALGDAWADYTQYKAQIARKREAAQPLLSAYTESDVSRPVDCGLSLRSRRVSVRLNG